MTTAQQNPNSADRRDLSTAEHQQRAEKWVREQAAKSNRPPSGAATGREFGMSPRWGQDRVNAVFPNADGRSRRTVGEEVRDRASARTDTDESITLTIGTDASARPSASASARPPAPPAPTGTASARDIGTATPPIGKAEQRASARPSARPGNAVPAGARLVAWLGFLFGAVVSVLANILQAWIPPAPPQGGDPIKWAAEWAPSIAEQAYGAAFPLILLLSVEGVARIPWPRGKGWVAVRVIGGGVVALGSGVISYSHLHGLLISFRYDWLSAALGPLVIDGLMLVCGFGLLAISQVARGKAKS
jgi:hypothetical protein